MSIMDTLIYYYFFTVFLLTQLVASECTSLVQTKSGLIRGRIIEVNNKEISVFTSIRYAKPPVGERRFRKPEPADSWSDIYDARIQRSICPQIKRFGGQLNESEDCLFLSVWTPSLNKTLIPVMVFFHGGGFLFGFSNESPNPSNNASLLATRDVVVVTINYRLGNLGFLYDGTDDAPGNMAFYDQILALKWVQDNIEQFGGDVNQVTIFGQSAGAVSTSFHLASPLSKGLFNRVIIQSGSAYHFNKHISEPTQVMDIGRQLAVNNSCNQVDWVRCLRLVNLKQLTDSNSLSAIPIIGDQFNPFGPVEGMKSCKVSPVKHLMAGVTLNEGTMFILRLVNGTNITRDNIKELISAVTKKTVMSIMQFNVIGPTIDQLYDYYFKPLSEQMWSNQTSLLQTLASIYGDAVIVCPLYLQVVDFLKLDPNHRAYFYLMSYQSSFSRMFCSQPWMGVCHADEVSLIFGTRKNIQGNKSDKEMSKALNYFWTNFAKTGSPTPHNPNRVTNGNSLADLQWPEFEPGINKVNVLNLDYPKMTTIYDPFAKKCNEFWKQFIYK